MRSSKHQAESSHEWPPESPAARKILAAARRSFFTHGLRTVTMDDLAREVGMSKKTLYANFSSKEALLQAVLLEKFRSIDRDLDRASAECRTDVLAGLQRLLACVQGHTEEIQPAFVRDIRREAPEMFLLVQRRRRDVIQRHFGKLFDAGRRAGIIRRDISTRVMIEILLGATEALMNPSKMGELDLTPKVGFVSIITVVFEGVLTAKGRTQRAPSGG